MSDPLRDYDLYEALQVKKELAQPHCDKCHEPIWDEYAWEIDGWLLCEDCARKEYRKPIDDFMEDYE